MQKITPFLWFDNNAEEAINLYTSLFPDSRITEIRKFEKADPDGNDILTAAFVLAGYEFMAMNAGPLFKFTPAISFSVNCETEAEVDRLWNKLVEGGQVMMELQEYPFSKKYGWLADKFRLSWQINLGESKQKITPSLMFVQENFGRAEEAIDFYTSLFRDSKKGMISRYGPEGGDQEGKINYAQFTLSGQEFSIMESNLEHKFTFSEAISLYVRCKDQDEVDYFWEKLTADGGEESQCGWLKDKYGISWQIVPKAYEELTNDPDPEKVHKVIQAMLQMKKLDVSKLQEAVNQ